MYEGTGIGLLLEEVDQISCRSIDGDPATACGPSRVGELGQGFQLFRLAGPAVYDGRAEMASN